MVTFLTLLGSAIGVIFLSIVADDAKECLAWVRERILRYALTRLTSDLRERYNEEWRADLNEIPGEIPKLIYSLGFVWSAEGLRKFASSLAQPATKGESLWRAVDIILSYAALVIFAPIFIVMSVAIKQTSGPVLFSRSAVGRNGQTFRVYKFRTMYVNADERLNNFLIANPMARDELEKSFWLRDDPRITPFGKFIRITSIDELPALINVLRGEMSILGPRPRSPEALGDMSTDQRELYLHMKPGILPPSSVLGDDRTLDIEIDHSYLHSHDRWIGSDFALLLKTIYIVMRTR